MKFSELSDGQKFHFKELSNVCIKSGPRHYRFADGVKEIHFSAREERLMDVVPDSEPPPPSKFHHLVNIEPTRVEILKLRELGVGVDDARKEIKRTNIRNALNALSTLSDDTVLRDLIELVKELV